MDVPEASAWPCSGQGPMTLPVLSHDEEMSTPGAITSGWVMPTRSPVKTVWPPAPIAAAEPLSNSRPLEEKSPRSRSTLPAATEMTHGAWLNGLTLASPSSLPELPAANTTVAPLVGDRLRGDVDRVRRVVLAEAVAPRVVEDVDPEHAGLGQRVVVGRHDGRGRDDRADREAGERGVGGDAEVGRARGAVGGDDAGDVGAVAAAQVGVAVGALVGRDDELRAGAAG